MLGGLTGRVTTSWKEALEGQEVALSVRGAEEVSGGTMVQPGCSDPGKPKLSLGLFSICTV